MKMKQRTIKELLELNLIDEPQWFLDIIDLLDKTFDIESDNNTEDSIDIKEYITYYKNKRIIENVNLINNL